MARKLFVGNLDRSIDDRGLTELFSPHGDVLQAEVIIDRQTGQSRRFGFVEMATEDQADRAMSALNGAKVVERSLRVSPARKREPASSEGNQRLRLRLPFRLVASRQRQPHEE